ncbi:hypothetical protein [Vibrio parahaemolyticus]|uniref:hypothetical protein n=1 Tax=Vibrio parahaemolyticus TaxID=670 RepID=UPI0004060E05|nr:hypothetical protein [Vibrio parahaemolyticus]
MEKVVSIIGGVVAIIGSMYASVLYIDNEVNDAIEKRLQPYEQIVIANSISGDKAIESYDFALEQLHKKRVDEVMLTSIVESYLSEIANNNYPHRYSHKVNKILKLIGDRVPLTAQMSNSLGWYYLSTDDLVKANRFFTKSLSLYRQDESKESASSYYGLFISQLAENNIESAIRLHDKAWDLDYDTFNPSTVLSSPFGNADWEKILTKVYPNLSKNYQRFVEYTVKVYDLKLEDRIKVKDVDPDILNQTTVE